MQKVCVFSAWGLRSRPPTPFCSCQIHQNRSRSMVRMIFNEQKIYPAILSVFGINKHFGVKNLCEDGV